MHLGESFKYNLPEYLRASFEEYRTINNLVLGRIILMVGAIFYGIFSIVDYLLIPELHYQFFIIRFYVVIPTILCTVIITFLRIKYYLIQPIIAFTVVVGGSGIVSMISSAPSFLNNYYYPGIILVFMLNYIFLNVSLKWSTIAGSLIVIYYEYVVLFKLDISTSDLIINNFFFLSANFLGVVTKIFLEYSQKREFYTNYQLEKIYNTVQNNNAQLEDIVKKRTEDLKNVNRELENEIKEKEIIEKNLVNSKDKAEKANQLKSEFLAQMSHEIRSPIGVINNFTYLLENLVETKGNDELELCFSGIESASKRIVRTIDLILNTSELQLGTFEPTFRKIDISELLNNIQHEYSIIAEKKNLKIIFIDDSENSLIFADDYALNQIFANLIDNAIKYTREGNITLTLHNNMKDYLTFTITDTGKGMSQEFLTKIFTPFTQEETGYSRKFEGNGLGLSLVKNYSEIINATISVISNQNVGTTFTIIFKNSQD